MVRVFANETGVQSQVESYQIFKKWYLIPQHYKVRIKSRWSNPGKGVVPSPKPWCSSYWKRSLRVTLNYGRSPYFLYYITLYYTILLYLYYILLIILLCYIYIVISYYIYIKYYQLFIILYYITLLQSLYLHYILPIMYIYIIQDLKDESGLKSSKAEKFKWWHHIHYWWHFLPIGSKHSNTDGRNVWTTKGTMLKNTLHLVAFLQSILVSLWTFQPTLVYSIYIIKLRFLSAVISIILDKLNLNPEWSWLHFPLS